VHLVQDHGHGQRTWTHDSYTMFERVTVGENKLRGKQQIMMLFRCLVGEKMKGK